MAHGELPEGAKKVDGAASGPVFYGASVSVVPFPWNPRSMRRSAARP
jgi:hypothetical protein